MKSILKNTIIAAAGTIILGTALGSCASSAVKMAENQPVAIMTVYGNRGVPWSTETDGSSNNSSTYETMQEDEGALTGLVNRIINRKNPEDELAQDRIDFASAELERHLAESGIELVSSEKIHKSGAYKKGVKSFLNYVESRLPAQGYDAIASSSSKLNKMIVQETGAQSLLYVSFRFEKQPLLNGVHTEGVSARVELSVYAANAKGKTIANKKYVAISRDAAPASHKDYDKEKLCSLFEDTTSAAISMFIMDLTDGMETEVALPAAENDDGGDKAPAEQEETTVSIPRPVREAAPQDAE